MKCRDCPSMATIANTEETRSAICKAFSAWRPIMNIDQECPLTPKPYTCANCNHFVENDTACFTAEATDSVYHNGKLCAGFVDQNEVVIANILYEWKMRGFNIKKKLKQVREEFEDEFQHPWEEHYEG